jgi:hypothetical protein
VERRLIRAARLKASPSDTSADFAELGAGDTFLMLENSVGWAWGYGGPQRLVGYVRSEALAG